MASSPNSILGGRGVRRTKRARRSYDRKAAPIARRRRARRTASQRTTTPTLKSRQAYLASRRSRLLAEIERRSSPRVAIRPNQLLRPTTAARKLPELERRLARVDAESDAIASRLHKRRSEQAAKDDPSTLEALEIASLGIPGIGLVTGGAKVIGGRAVAGGLRALLGRGAKETAEEVAPVIARRSGVRGAAKGAGERVAQRAPRTAKAARGAGRAAKGTAKVGGKAVAFPVRHPLKTTKYSVMAQAPVALQSGDVSDLTAPFRGEGVVADVAGAVSGAVADLAPGEVAQNLVKDVLELPANTPPAIYLPIAGIVEAAQGDSSRLEGLWEDYTEQGFIPAVISGDKDRILDAIKSHPLYAGLEASGARAVVGRGAGAIARRTPIPRVRQLGSQRRKPLHVEGTKIRQNRDYSPDLIEKAFQVAGDVRRQRRYGGQYANPRQRSRLTNERVDRLVAGIEGVRRAERQAQLSGAQAAIQRPGLRGRLPGRISKIAAADQEGVSLAVQGIVRSPQTFAADLTAYARRLDRQAAKMQSQIQRATSRVEKRQTKARLKQNRAMRAQVERVRRDGNPGAIFAAARENAEVLRRQTAELEEQGLLGEGQGARAAAIPFAVEHMGAKFGRPAGQEFGPAQLLDREGRPLTTEAIEAAMRRQGAEQPAYVTQRPAARGPGSFFRAAWPNRQTLPKAARTGKATRQGAFDASYDAVLEQRVRNAGIINAVKGFDKIVGELSVGGLRFKSHQAARDAILNPRAYGLPAEVNLVPVRLAPFSARSAETRRAEKLFDALDPSDQLGRRKVAEQLADASLQEGPGPVVLLPAQAARRLKDHYTAATTFRRAAQLVSSTFKGVVLPLSPNWILGNVVDVSMRSMLSGTIPWGRDAHLGRRLMREVAKRDPEAAQQLAGVATPGALMGSAAGSRVHRDARQFAETGLAPMAAAFGAVRRAPGVRNVVNGYRRYRDVVFDFNDKFIERQAQYAQLGKAARREVREATGSWHKALKLGDDAIADLAKGLLKTDKQIAYAKSVERVLGQWTSFGPDTRAFLVDYAPFGAWARAASRYVFLTLPGRHPIKTALFATAAEMTEEERVRLGLSLLAKEGERLPPNLQGSIPLADGSLLAPQTITSFGYVADYQQSLSNAILPQVPLAELAGLDWTGDRLTNPDGTPAGLDTRAKAVLWATAEAYLPFVALGRRMAEQGAYEGAVPRALRPYDPGLVDYLQSLSGKRAIQVPASSGSSDSGDSSSTSAGSFEDSSSDRPQWSWESGGTDGVTAPWRSSTGPTGVSAPWRR